MASTIHRSAFLKALRRQIPAVEPYLVGQRANLTLEMLAFGALTREAIRTKDRSLVQRCFELADWAYTNGNKHLKNTIAVSYLEGLSFPKATDIWAEALLPRQLRDVRAGLLKYWADLERRSPGKAGHGRLTTR